MSRLERFSPLITAFGAVTACAGAALVSTGIDGERNTEASLARQAELFIEDIGDTRALLLAQQTDLTGEAALIVGALGPDCMALVLSNDFSDYASLSRPADNDCGVADVELHGVQTRLDQIQESAGGIARQLSLIDYTGDNVAAARRIIDEATNDSYLGDVLDFQDSPTSFTDLSVGVNPIITSVDARGLPVIDVTAVSGISDRVVEQPRSMRTKFGVPSYWTAETLGAAGMTGGLAEVGYGALVAVRRRRNLKAFRATIDDWENLNKNFSDLTENM